MSTIQAANLHLESTGNNRIQYAGTNTFSIVAGGANTLTVNSTAAIIANLNLESTGNNRIQYTGTNTFIIVAGGANTVTVNSTKVDVSGSAVHNPVAISVSDMDLSIGQVFTKTITSANTITISNTPASRAMTIVLHLTNGGANTITWTSAIKWPSAIAPTLTASGLDVLVFNTVDGGTSWRGNIFGKDIK